MYVSDSKQTALKYHRHMHIHIRKRMQKTCRVFVTFVDMNWPMKLFNSYI